jgi:membrane fusion protein (multidrug efflux system)
MKRICLSLAGFAFAVLLTGCGKKEEAVPRPLPPVPPPVPPVVQITKAKLLEAPAFTAIATLEGSTRTEIHARIGGYLIRQDYHEGAFVKQGALLFEMDARPFQAALEKAKADLIDKQAHSTAQAEVDAARAAVKTAQDNLNETKVFAPSEGVVGRAGQGLGDLIPADAPLTTLSTVDPIKAVFILPKKFYLDNSKQLAQASFELLLAGGTPYSHKGKWGSVDVGAQASSNPVTACVLFPNPDRVLHPNQYAKVRVAHP